MKLSAGETPNTAIVTSSSAYIVELRAVAKGIDLEVDEIGVVEYHKKMTTCIDF